MVNTRPEILKIPQNLWLLAEARAARVGLYDAVQEVEQLLHIIEQDPPIDPYFKNRLCTQIDAGEMLLQECQGKLDELVNIYSGSCNDIHQLTADLSTYKEKFVGVKERCQYFLPDKNLNIPAPPVMTSQPSKDPAVESNVQHTDIFTVPEDPLSLSDTNMEQRDHADTKEMHVEPENLSNFQHRVLFPESGISRVNDSCGGDTCEVYDPEGAPGMKQGITAPPEFSPLAWHRDSHPDGVEDMAQEGATEASSARLGLDR